MLTGGGPARPARTGVVGWPVAHSRSPQMHEAAFRAAGLEGWRYQRLPVPAELFAETVHALPRSGFAGVNVTIPHKEAASALADSATEAAVGIGAANTLWWEDGRLHADNTDAPGLLAALGEPPAGRRALVLGAGGSARAAVWALAGAGAEVLVWNRTPQRAADMAGDLGGAVVAGAEPADVLVNCTAVGLPGGPEPWDALPLDAASVGGYACVVDLAYGDTETALAGAARAAGARVVDGLDVLVEQGALSFERWTGRPAPREAMRAGARGG